MIRRGQHYFSRGQSSTDNLAGRSLKVEEAFLDKSWLLKMSLELLTMTTLIFTLET